MSRKPKIQWGFGFDPSINHSAWATVSSDGTVHCGMIWNTYKHRPIEHWDKLKCMIDEVHGYIHIAKGTKGVPRPDVWVVEGQYTARGKGSPDIQVRNGWISALVYTLGHGVCPRLIAMPHSWTGRESKEDRIELLLDRVDDPEKWKWHSAIPPKHLMHNVWDAVGLALWGLEQKGLI